MSRKATPTLPSAITKKLSQNLCGTHVPNERFSIATTDFERGTEGELPPWPALPTETEIYILPDGRVIVADLPAELAPLVAELGLSASPPPSQANPLPPHEQ
jgi:hypothetical protein